MFSKKDLTERDICTKFVMPALEKAGWDKHTQLLEEFPFTDGRITFRGKSHTRGERKRADFILYYKPNIPIAIIEAKDNTHSARAGLQQGLNYADILDIPCVFSTNGDSFIYHNRANEEVTEVEIGMDNFPSPEELWEEYKKYKGIVTKEEARVAAQDYFDDGSKRKPRYYQQIAINRTVEAIAKGQDRILLVMATGTGKTYTAFQIIHRLWKSGTKKRILFLADRNALIDQTRRKDFKHFKDKMTVVKHRMIDKSYEIYLAIYQGLTGETEAQDVFKQFSPEFFDLIVVDECHRGSAADDSKWREVLNYFSKATHIGMTATPRETDKISNIEYFGEPIYTYSLKQGIDDGFLAPYRVVRIGTNVDLEGWRPEKDKKDIFGNEVEDRQYNRGDYDRSLVIEERTKVVAKKITEFLKGTDRYDKTIVFCVDVPHAERMRHELVNLNGDLVKENPKYIMQITGDNEEGKRELDNFIDSESRYPVIATTSHLMRTGIDAQTCKLIVLDAIIRSPTEFKQIIGRGTRIEEDYGKFYFTILDFRNATDQFADPNFDGDPVRIKTVSEDTDISTIVDDEVKEAEEQGELETITDIAPPTSTNQSNDDEEDKKKERREKIIVNGIDVSVLVERALYFDAQGKPITVSLKDYTRAQVRNEYASLKDFLTVWNKAEQKTAIIEELQQRGILLGDWEKAVNKELDPFDLICHTAFDMPPLTRKERAENVRKRNYFTKYGDVAKQVLNALLDKYADEGIENVESRDILKVNPFSSIGTPMEIIRAFGSAEKYDEAIKELEQELYRTAA